MIQFYPLLVVELEVIYLYLFLSFYFYKILLLLLLSLLMTLSPTPATTTYFLRLLWKQNKMKNIYEKCLTNVYIEDHHYYFWNGKQLLMLSSIFFNINAPSPTCFQYSHLPFISLSMTSKTPLTGQKVTFLDFWDVWLLRLFCDLWHFPLILFLSKIIYCNLKVKIQKVITIYQLLYQMQKILSFSLNPINTLCILFSFGSISQEIWNSISITSSGYMTAEVIKREIKQIYFLIMGRSWFRTSGRDDKLGRRDISLD